jgi:hypothetical protein
MLADPRPAGQAGAVPALAEVLVAGQQAGQSKLEELAGGGGSGAVNGWTSALHLFDYHLDRLGLGTIDAPEWKIPTSCGWSRSHRSMRSGR